MVSRTSEDPGDGRRPGHSLRRRRLQLCAHFKERLPLSFQLCSTAQTSAAGLPERRRPQRQWNDNRKTAARKAGEWEDVNGSNHLRLAECIRQSLRYIGSQRCRYRQTTDSLQSCEAGIQVAHDSIHSDVFKFLSWIMSLSIISAE